MCLFWRKKQYLGAPNNCTEKTIYVRISIFSCREKTFQKPLRLRLSVQISSCLSLVKKEPKTSLFAALYAVGVWAWCSSALWGPEPGASPVSSLSHPTTQPTWSLTSLSSAGGGGTSLIIWKEKKKKEQKSRNLQPPAFQEACFQKVPGWCGHNYHRNGFKQGRCLSGQNNSVITAWYKLRAPHSTVPLLVLCRGKNIPQVTVSSLTPGNCPANVFTHLFI